MPSSCTMNLREGEILMVSSTYTKEMYFPIYDRLKTHCHVGDNESMYFRFFYKNECYQPN
jgi:hypothetical protein